MFTLKVKKNLNFEEISKAETVEELGQHLIQAGYFFFPWIIVDEDDNIIKSGGEEE